jgi:hypothetical protein
VTSFLEISFYVTNKQNWERKKEQEGSHLYYVEQFMVYGLGSFMNGKEKEALQQGLAPHTLSHSATVRTGMISRLQFMPIKMIMNS